jgi:hypothetical protein
LPPNEISDIRARARETERLWRRRSREGDLAAAEKESTVHSVLEVAASRQAETPAIGTLNEGALHAQLKDWYRRRGDRIEQVVDGFVVDLVRGNLLVEIQTGSFAPLRRKLDLLTQRYRVRLVGRRTSSTGSSASPRCSAARTSSSS